ncbi:MAG: hypothetical protein E4G98_07130 [Promethearchaeota archaeon]|nr:MAG: hypothetical protein E4G98_07130 [Candidatus Lokiarchaeota archaeon]
MVLVEIYIITKPCTLLHKYNLLASEQSDKDQLVGGFLSALNGFASEIGFPAGVSLIRSGNLEARFSPGEYVFSVLMIDYFMPLSFMIEPILSGLAREMTEIFEITYENILVLGEKQRIYKAGDFEGFRKEIDRLIDKYGYETNELYQKLILIEGLYAKVPQKWILPLMEKISDGENILNQITKGIPEIYHDQMRKVIQKVNIENKPILDIFALPLLTDI